MSELRVDASLIDSLNRELEILLGKYQQLAANKTCQICGITATNARVAGHFWERDRICSACQPTGPTPISSTPDVM